MESLLAAKKFADLSEREILAMAIASEEEDNRVYLMFAEDLRALPGHRAVV